MAYALSSNEILPQKKGRDCNSKKKKNPIFAASIKRTFNERPARPTPFIHNSLSLPSLSVTVDRPIFTTPRTFRHSFCYIHTNHLKRKEIDYEKSNRQGR